MSRIVVRYIHAPSTVVLVASSEHAALHHCPGYQATKKVQEHCPPLGERGQAKARMTDTGRQ